MSGHIVREAVWRVWAPEAGPLNGQEWWSAGSLTPTWRPCFLDAKALRLASSEARGIRELARLAQLEKRRAGPLDAACGTGRRHSLEFARLGHPVLGVDAAAAYVPKPGPRPSGRT